MSEPSLEKSSENAKEGCMLCGLCICGGGAVIATLTWFVTSAVALSRFNDADVRAACPNSDLWPALLTWVIIVGLSLFGGGKSAASDDEGARLVSGVLTLCIWIGLDIWLGSELYSTCVQNNLSDTNLYMMSFIWFIVAWAIIGIVIVGSGVTAYVFICKQSDGKTFEVPDPASVGDMESQTTNNIVTNSTTEYVGFSKVTSAVEKCLPGGRPLPLAVNPYMSPTEAGAKSDETFARV
jgi:hypothetical protein